MNNFFLSCKECKKEGPRSFYGSFYLGPFSGSQSLTVANALRRTLLSELTGISITSVIIQGAKHEFSTLVGIRESVLDILLNLKEIVLKSNSKNFSISSGLKTQIGYLHAYGPGVVRAGDLKLPAGIQCVDPDQYIATLSPDGILVMKFTINEGKNYINKTIKNKEYFFKQSNGAEDLSSEKNESVPMLLDSVFMPVNKVNYLIEPYVHSPGMSLVGRNKVIQEKTNLSELSLFNSQNKQTTSSKITVTDQDTSNFNMTCNKEFQVVVLEIWTNGSLHPRTALYQGLNHLMNLFSQLEKMKILNSLFTKIILTDNQLYENTFQKVEYEYEYHTQLEQTWQNSKIQNNILTEKTQKGRENDIRNPEDLMAAYKKQYKKELFLKSDLKNIQVINLNISNRSRTLLERAKILNLFELINSSEKSLKQIQGFGPKCLQEVKKAVEEIGLSLKDE